MAARFSTMSRGQVFALVFGIGYLVSSVGAYIYSDGLTGGTEDDKLLLFRTNYAHAIVHLLLGIGWLVAYRSVEMARRVNLLFGVVLLLVALLGFTGIDLMHTLINVGDSLDADNFLHLGSGLLALYYGTAGAGARTTAPAT